MSVSGIESEMKWVKKALDELKSEVEDLDNKDLTDSFDKLESQLEDLMDECEDTITRVQEL